MKTSILILIVLLAIAVVWGLYRFKRETETQPTRHFSGMQNDGRAEAFISSSAKGCVYQSTHSTNVPLDAPKHS